MGSFFVDNHYVRYVSTTGPDDGRGLLLLLLSRERPDVLIHVKGERKKKNPKKKRKTLSTVVHDTLRRDDLFGGGGGAKNRGGQVVRCVVNQTSTRVNSWFESQSF